MGLHTSWTIDRHSTVFGFLEGGKGLHLQCWAAHIFEDGHTEMFFNANHELICQDLTLVVCEYLIDLLILEPKFLLSSLISVRLFCPRKSKESEYFSKICEYSYISHHTHSQQLYTNSQTFGHPSHRFSTCMPTISEDFITCPCTILTPFRIFNVIPICHTNICRTFGNTWTLIQSILQHS